MKKIMAVVVTVMMLAAMITSLPVYASEEVNLLVNGDFEADEAGAETITGWDHMYETNKFVVEAGGTGNMVKALNDSEGGENNIDLDTAGLSQEIEINKTDAWYIDFEDYYYTLSYDAYKGGSVYRGNIKVIMTDSSGKISEKDYTGDQINVIGEVFRVNSIFIDLGDQAATFGNPIEKIELQLFANSNRFYMTFDNIKLTPVYSPAPESLLTNGGFENVTEGVLDEWDFLNTTQASAHITDDPEGAHGGSSYLVFTGISNEVAKTKVECEPGKTYMFEVSYKADTAYAAKVQMYDNKGKSASFQGTRPETPSSWQTVRVMITLSEYVEEKETEEGAEPTEEKPFVEIYISNDIAEATVYYDSAKFYCMEGYDYRNMITNHDFEVDSPKNSEYENITNWNSGNGVKLATDYVYSGRAAIAARQGNNAITGVILYADTPEEVETERKYTFGVWLNDNSVTPGRMPSMRMMFYKVVPDGSLSAVGNELSYTFTPEEVNVWKYESFVFDVPAGCNYVRIDLFGGAGWTRFDDLSLRKVETCVDIKDADGKIVTQLPETAEGAYTAVAQYAGEEGAEAGKLYLAEYTKDADGDLMLTGIVMAAISADGAVNTLDISGVDNSDGSKVIKAFVWAGEVTPKALTATK